MPKFKNPSSLLLYNALLKEKTFQELNTSEDELKELVLSISEGCNLGCTYCFADKGKYGNKKETFMPFETAKLTIDGILKKYTKIKSIKFFGGEPLLNFTLIKETCDYFKYLLENGIISSMPLFTMVTNLTILSKQMLAYFSNYEFYITVSLDGPKRINDEFRKFDNRTGSFDIVSKNIRILKDTIGDRIRIESTYSPFHLNEGMTIVDLYEFFVKQYEIYNIIIHPVVDNEFYKMVFTTYAKENFVKFYDEMFKMATEYGKHLVDIASSGKEIFEVYLFLEEMLGKHTNNHCGLGVDKINLTSKGVINPCYTLTNKDEFIMADVTKGEEIFTTKFSNVQLKFLENKKSHNDVCSKCDILYTCKACPGLMHQQHNSINSVIPLTCDYLVGIKEGMLLGMNEISNDTRKWAMFINSINLIKNKLSNLEFCD